MVDYLKQLPADASAYDFTTARRRLFTNAGATVPVAADGDLIIRCLDLTPNNRHRHAGGQAPIWRSQTDVRQAGVSYRAGQNNSLFFRDSAGAQLTCQNNNWTYFAAFERLAAPAQFRVFGDFGVRMLIWQSGGCAIFDGGTERAYAGLPDNLYPQTRVCGGRASPTETTAWADDTIAVGSANSGSTMNPFTGDGGLVNSGYEYVEYGGCFLPRAATDAEVQAMRDYCYSLLYRPRMVVVSNSLVDTTTASVARISLPFALRDALNAGRTDLERIEMIPQGFGGRSTTVWLTKMAELFNGWASNQKHRQCYVILWEGTNDIAVAGMTQTQALANYAEFVRITRAMIPGAKIITGTCLPRVDTVYTQFNNAVYANVGGIYGDYIVPVHLQPLIGKVETTSDLTYYDDVRIHLTPAGQALNNPLFMGTVDRALSPAAPVVVDYDAIATATVTKLLEGGIGASQVFGV